MQIGLTVSLLLHAVLLGWALVSFKATPPLKIPEIQPVEVAIITSDDLVRLRKGDRRSKKLETRPAESTKKAKPTKKKVRKIKPRPAPPPKTAPPPPSQPTKIKIKEVKPKPDAIAKKLAGLQEPAPKPKPKPAVKKPKPVVKKKPPPKKKVKPKPKKPKKQAKKTSRRKKQKKSFDELMQQLKLDKRKPLAKPSGSPTTVARRNLPRGPQAGAAEGRDQRLTASEKSLLISRIENALRACWRIPGGGGGRDVIPVVRLAWKLDRDGRLRGEPKVIDGGSGPFAGLAVSSAIRAVKQCQPFDLPPRLYKHWRSIDEWSFDPRDLY